MVIFLCIEEIDGNSQKEISILTQTYDKKNKKGMRERERARAIESERER
jgi:hypothetical protein